ncbi:hypothetical protein ACWC5I_37125, partial [Kitasatospora sp. NPDC001574]
MAHRTGSARPEPDLDEVAVSWERSQERERAAPELPRVPEERHRAGELRDDLPVRTPLHLLTEAAQRSATPRRGRAAPVRGLP